MFDRSYRLPASTRDQTVRSLVTSFLVPSMLALLLLLSPATAYGRQLASDTIADVPLDESGLDELAPDVTAASGLVMDSTGRVLWARSAENKRAMASVTKIMTTLIALENADLDDMVTISEKASSIGWAIGLEPGEMLTVRRLIEYALVASSNDAALALAEHVGGSEAGFVRMMNEHAEELHLDDTHYVNPHGLDASGHHSSAIDIARLAQIAMQNPEFRRIVAIEEIELGAYKDRPAETIESTDELLGEYEGLFGVKTGFTDDADYCFVGAASKDEIALTTVVLGSPTNEARFSDTSLLLDWGFTNLTMRTIATATETVDAVPLVENIEHEVPVGYEQTTRVPVFEFDGELATSISVETEVSLPVYEGQPLGEARFHQGDRVVATLPLVATEDVSSAEEIVGAVPVSDYIDVDVTVRASGDPVDVPEFDPEVAVIRTVVLSPKIKAPVSEGDLLGEIVYSQNDEIIMSVPAVAAEDIESPSAIQRVTIWFERVGIWLTGAVRRLGVTLPQG